MVVFVKACRKHVEGSEAQQYFTGLPYSRVVPCIHDIGLWGDSLQDGLRKLGVIDSANADLEWLMRNDDQLADDLDKARFEREEDLRSQQVAHTIEEGKLD
ncbi:hypothetical protein [Nocardia sp. NPDC059239]|uniref:hypothetical protein n=1 Tax=Nocardia sp. NPDC059239 TaxID=3346785 RepID=UPI0036C3CA13